MKTLKTIAALLFVGLLSFENGFAVSAEETSKITISRFEGKQNRNEKGGAITVFQQNWLRDQAVFLQNSAPKGGALKASQAFVKIGSGRFEKNKASAGGALAAWQATGVIFDGDFIENSAQTGGAVFNEEGKIVLNGAFFSENSVSEGDGTGGGAIFNRQGVVVLHDSYLSGNLATDQNGGAISNIQGTVIVVDSDFEKNQAAHGGAVSNIQGTFVVDGVTFDSNRATNSNGGAIDCFQGLLILKDSDFFSNTALSGRGAVASLFQVNAIIVVYEGFHSIIAGNLDKDGANSIHIESHGNLTLQIDKGGLLDMRDPMSGRSERRTINISKKGAGLWKLGGTNRISGPATFEIEQGTVRLYRKGEVQNANQSNPMATVEDGQIILDDAESKLIVKNAELEIAGDNFIQSKQMQFQKGSSIRFCRASKPEDKPSALRLQGNVSFEDTALSLNCYAENQCETIQIEGETETARFQSIELADPKPGTYAILRAEQGIKNISLDTISVAAPGFSAKFTLDENGKQLNLTLKNGKTEK